ncbi:MAG: hypothetical protein R3D55_06010 [Chloroflexota bacterium]
MAVTVVGTALMLAIFGAYERVLKHNHVLMSGLLVVVASLAWWWAVLVTCSAATSPIC